MRQNFYRIILFLGFGTWVLVGQAQYEWRNLGPDNLGSATRALAFDNAGNILAGSQGGGLWRSTNGGESWGRVVSYDASGGNPNITSIAVDGATIYVATGATRYRRPFVVSNLRFNPDTYDYRTSIESFIGNLDGLPGAGIFVSTDNGATWSNNNATTKAPYGTLSYQGPFVDIQKLELSGGRLYIGTAEGLFFSDNGLQSVARINGPEFLRTQLIWDVEVAADGFVFAVAHKQGRTVFDSLYVSEDNGNSFRPVLDPLLLGGGSQNFGFAGSQIAVSPSNPNIVYVASTQANLELNGIFRFNTADRVWTRVAPRGNPGFTPLSSNGRFAFVLEVFPDNPEELIVAGSNWYTYLLGRGWTQTAQHTNPTAENFIPRSQFTVLFDPSNPRRLFVGTSRQIVRSDDRAQTFFQRSKGYEAAAMYSVASFGVDVEAQGSVTASYDVVFGGSGVNGTVYNRFYNSGKPSSQAFGVVDPTNYGNVAASYLHPGALLAQGADGGPVRSINFGDNFEQFYGFPISPQVANIVIPSTVDTIIDRPNTTQAGGNLNNNPVVAQAAWVLDEVVPDNILDRTDITTEEVQAASASYIFFCSKNYVWIANGAFDDLLQVKWNRLTNALVDGISEFFTAIAVSGDNTHTLYVGSNKGNIWRIDRAHDLANFDAVANVTKLNIDFVSYLSFEMAGRSVSSLAVDPLNPNRLVVTFTGYGDVGTPSGFVWATDSARSARPGFGLVASDGLRYENQLFHSSAFVVENVNGIPQSVLMLGGNDGLYSVRGLNVEFYTSGQLPQPYNWPFYSTPTWTREFAADFGPIPVYDIYVRRYKVRVAQDALIRQEIRNTTLPDGTVVTDTIEVERDNLRLTRDQTVFVATHGRGIWSSSTPATQRDSRVPEPEEPVLLAGVKVYPNPSARGEAALRTLEIALPSKADVQISITGLDGRLVYSQSLSLAAGVHRQTLGTADLAAGVYLVRVEMQGESWQEVQTIKAQVTE
ncbi:MAG: hypothetical protein OHK0039_34160 [Bacteroidia bacterium]